MTQLQKLAWFNVAFLPLLVAVIVLRELEVLPHTAQLTVLSLLLVVLMGTMVFMAKMPWHQGTVEDERDRRFRQRSFAAAYFVLIGCLTVGLLVSIFAFPGEQVPLRFVAGWLGTAGIASMLGQSVTLLVQYRKGIRNNT